MPVNFNLLRQAGPANFAEGLMQGQEDARRNALAQQQATQQQQMNALAMRKSELGIKSLEDEQVNTRRTQKAGMFRERLLRAPTPEAARQLVVAQYNDPDLAPVLSQAGTLEQALAEVSDDPVKFEQYKQQEAMGMAEWMKSQMPKVAGNAVYLPAENRFITPPREPAPVAPSAPVAVMGADGRPQYVSREQAIGMTPFTPATVKLIGGAGAPAAAAGMGVSAQKPLTEQQSIKLRSDVAKDYKSATNTLSQMDDLLDSIDAVKTAPGLSAATGYTGKYLPSFSGGEAAQAETRLANLRGKVTALGKTTAAMSGAIGSIANQEWKILADQIAALDEVKGKGPLLEQIELVEQQAKGAIERLRDVYEKSRYEDFERFPQFRNLPASRTRGAKPGTSNIAPPPGFTPD